MGPKTAEDPRPQTGAGTTEYAMESGVMEVSGLGARNGCGGSDDRRAERMDRGQSLTHPSGSEYIMEHTTSASAIPRCTSGSTLCPDDGEAGPGGNLTAVDGACPHTPLPSVTCKSNYYVPLENLLRICEHCVAAKIKAPIGDNTNSPALVAALRGASGNRSAR